jgi:hypothetical protein
LFGLSETCHLPCSCGWFGLDFAFPDPQHPPACPSNCVICREIAVTIDGQLCPPTIGIRAAELRGTVLRTTVPETSVDEDRNVIPGQNHIWLIPADTTVQSEPEAESVYSSA